MTHTDIHEIVDRSLRDVVIALWRQMLAMENYTRLKRRELIEIADNHITHIDSRLYDKSARLLANMPETGLIYEHAILLIQKRFPLENPFQGANPDATLQEVLWDTDTLWKDGTLYLHVKADKQIRRL
jgi:hypothetical protein